MKRPTRKLDSITILLWFFILFTIAIFIYLTKVDEHNEHFSAHNNTVNELKIINKVFNNFLLQQTLFINYDNINKTILKFGKKVHSLTAMDKDGGHFQEYVRLSNEVERTYKLKVESIESFKSINAQLLHSIHYLFDLNGVISKSKKIDPKSKEIVNATLLYLMRYYINATIDNSYILNNLEYLNRTVKEDESIKIFNQHIKVNLSRIKSFNEIKNLQENDTLESALNELHLFLSTTYENNIFIEKVIVAVLFALAVLILIILILMNKRSRSLRDELEGFKVAIENSYNSIVITDTDSNITYINDVAIHDTGYPREELIGQNPRILKSGLNDKSFYDELHNALNRGKKWDGEFINRRKDGSLFYEKASIMPIYNNGRISSYLAIKLNITDYIEEKHKVEYMAYHDSLTGLPNRTSIEEYITNRIPIAKRSSSKLALLFIDLDRFKTINDTLGHDVGDELLIESAKRMRSALRDADMLGRVGGDEFVIIIESPSNDYSAAHVCEKVLELFKEPIKTKNHMLNVTLSIGVSIYPDDNLDAKQLFKYADIAMYEAKDAGKNTYRYYQKELSIEVHQRLNMEQNLKDALSNSELYLMYQPKYNIMTRNIVGLEALVRWENPLLGNVRPDMFIPVAEDTGIIIDIGLFIFEQACRDFLIFQNISKTLDSISINISTVQLYQESFIDDIMNITKKVGIQTHSIKLEITETHIMKNTEYSVRLLQELKDLGFSISIDDFGTGHSSLSYLKLFPIDELKIDKSFVDDLPHDTNDVAISKAIITLSKSMGYINVAEGIEDVAQEHFLRDNGCYIGQGYYFCRPKGKADLLEFLKS